MEINKSENEIVIKIDKNNYFFEKLKEMENLEEFIDYVLDLQRYVDGCNTGELPGYEVIDIYKEEIKGFTKQKLEEEKKLYLEQLKCSIDDISSVSTGKYCESFYTPDGIIAIEESDNLRLMQMAIDRVIAIEDLLAKEI